MAGQTEETSRAHLEQGLLVAICGGDLAVERPKPPLHSAKKTNDSSKTLENPLGKRRAAVVDMVFQLPGEEQAEGILDALRDWGLDAQLVN